MARTFRSGRSIPSPKLKRKARKRLGSIDGDYVPTSPERIYHRPIDPSYRPSRNPSTSSSDSPPASTKAKKKSPKKPVAAALSVDTIQISSLPLPDRPRVQNTAGVRGVVEHQRRSSLKSTPRSNNSSPQKRVSFDLNTIEAEHLGSRLGSYVNQRGVHEVAAEEWQDMSTLGLDGNAVSDNLWHFESHLSAGGPPPRALGNDRYALQNRSPLRGSGDNAEKYLFPSHQAARERTLSSSSASSTPSRNVPATWSTKANYLPTPPATPMSKMKKMALATGFSGKHRPPLSRSPFPDSPSSFRSSDEETGLPLHTEGPVSMLAELLNKQSSARIFSMDDIAACFKHIQAQAHVWASQHFSFLISKEEGAVQAWPLHLLKTRYRALLSLTEEITESSSSPHQQGWNHFFTSSDSRVALIYSITGWYIMTQIFSSIERDLSSSSTTTTQFASVGPADYPYMKPDELHDYAIQGAESILTIIEPLMPPSVFDYMSRTKTWGLVREDVFGFSPSRKIRQRIKDQLSALLRNCVALKWAVIENLWKEAAATNTDASHPHSTTTIRILDQVQKGMIIKTDNDNGDSRDGTRPSSSSSSSSSNRVQKVTMICWPGVEACTVVAPSGASPDKDEDEDGDINMPDIHHVNNTKAHPHEARYTQTLCEQHIYCTWEERGNSRSKEHTSPPRQSLRQAVDEAAREWRQQQKRRQVCRHLRRHRWKYHAAAVLLGAGWACVRAASEAAGV